MQLCCCNANQPTAPARVVTLDMIPLFQVLLIKHILSSLFYIFFYAKSTQQKKQIKQITKPSITRISLRNVLPSRISAYYTEEARQ